MKKIIGISGSPRKNGNSEYALNYIMEKCADFAETNKISLYDKKIDICDGCLVCEDTQECKFKDDMIAISKEILEADIIVIATPVYFDNVPSMLKNFIDRTNPICNMLRGKKAYIVTFGQADEISWERARQSIGYYFEVMQITLESAASFKARNIGEANNDPLVKEKLDELIDNIQKSCI